MKIKMDMSEIPEPTLDGQEFKGKVMRYARTGMPKEGEIYGMSPESSGFVRSALGNAGIGQVRHIYEPLEPKSEFVEYPMTEAGGFNAFLDHAGATHYATDASALMENGHEFMGFWIPGLSECLGWVEIPYDHMASDGTWMAESCEYGIADDAQIVHATRVRYRVTS